MHCVFQGKERFAGESAAPLARSNYKNTIRCVNVSLRDYDAPETQAELNLLQDKPLEDGRVGIRVVQRWGTEPHCEAALGCILTKVKEIVAAENPGTRRPDIVLSVPGYFTDAMRRATLDAVEIAGLNCLSLMNEHTATALAYGIYKNNRREFDEKEQQHVMFIDLGHSSYTVCVVAFVQGRLQVSLLASTALWAAAISIWQSPTICQLCIKRRQEMMPWQMSRLASRC